MDWVSVDEELPPKFSIVLAKRQDNTVLKSYYHGDGLGRMACYYKPGVISNFQAKDDMSFLHDVTHWKDLT